MAGLTAQINISCWRAALWVLIGWADNPGKVTLVRDSEKTAYDSDTNFFDYTILAICFILVIAQSLTSKQCVAREWSQTVAKQP